MPLVFNPFTSTFDFVNASSSGGTVNSIVAGQNISVDDSDPVNPSVSVSTSLINITDVSGPLDSGITVRANNATPTDADGLDVQFYASIGNGTGNGGQAVLSAGPTGAAGGKGGLVNIQGGGATAGSNGSGGDILLLPGAADGSGIPGHIHIGNYIGTDVILDNQSVTADRTYTFPDQSGTFALLTDITGGGISRSISSISSPTTAGAVPSTDYVYLVSGTTTLTLPTAVGNTNRYTVKNTGSNTVTIATTSAQTIDGSSTASLTPNTSLDLISDNSNWSVV